MKIVGGLLLSVFCVGSAFSSEMEYESFVFERTSDDILQKMTFEEYISKIKELEEERDEVLDAYDNMVLERDYYRNVADQLGIALKERTAQLIESNETLRETVEMIGQD